MLTFSTPVASTTGGAAAIQIGDVVVPAGAQKLCVAHIIDDSGANFNFSDMRYDTNGGDDISLGAPLFNTHDGGVTVHRPVAYYEFDLSARTLPETIQLSGILDGADAASWFAWTVGSDTAPGVLTRTPVADVGAITDAQTSTIVLPSSPTDTIYINFAMNAVVEGTVVKSTGQTPLATAFNNSCHHNVYTQAAGAGSDTTITFGQSHSAGAQEFSSLALAYYEDVATVLDVEDVDGDEQINDGQTNIAITDAQNLFEDAQGSGSVEIDAVAQATINSWAAGVINFDRTPGSTRYGFLDLVVKTNSSGDYLPISIEIIQPFGLSWVNLTDVSNSKITALPALSAGDQLRHSSVTAVNGFPVAVDSTGDFTIDKSSNPSASLIGDSFDAGAHDGSSWGATATQDLYDPIDISSGTIDAVNLAVTYNLDIALGGSYANTDFSLTIDGDPRTVTSIDVTGNVQTFTYSGAPVSAGQTVLLSHVDPGDGVEAVHNGEDLPDITNFAVTNSVSSDTTPDAFSFTDQNNVEPGATVTSNTLTLSGTDATAAVTVTNGEVSIAGAAFTTGPTTIDPGQTFAVRGTAGAHDATVNVDLDIGGITDTFSFTTRSADTTPNAFGFTDAVDVGLSSVITSNTITITGLLDAAAISVDVGELSIDGAPFVSGPTTISNGQTLAVRHTSSGSNSASVDQTVNIGGVTDIFSTTTAAADPAPTVVLSVSAGIKNGAFDVTVTFNEDVTGLLLADFVVGGGTAVSLTPVSAQVYTLSVMPTAASEGNVTVDLPAGSAIDSGSNGNVAATQLVVQYDTLAPAVTLSTAAGTKTGQFTVDVSFPESVTGLIETDFSVTNGTIASLSGSGASYTLTIDPTNDDLGNVLVQLLASTVIDVAGNENPASAVLSVPYDTLFVNTAPVLNNATLSALTTSPEGTLVGTIAATDPDAQTLEYTILGGNSGAAFALDPLTGELTINQALTQPIYQLTVQVSDGTDTDTAVISVTVTTSLSNSPPVIQSAEFSVSEAANIADIVGTVTAADPDNSDTIVFEIVSGNELGDFAIDSVTGQITVAGALRFLTVSRYDLVVAVTDTFGEIVGANVTITVLPATLNLPTTQSILGDILFYPGIASRSVNTLYPGNTHVVEVKNLRYSLSKTLIDNATITVTIKDADGNNLTGETWPLALVLAASGHYWQGISSGLNLTGLDEAIAEVTITTPGGSNAFWRVNLGVSDRVL